jgi:predicted transcriptional regulator
MTNLTVHVGSLEDMGRRFVDAFERARSGEDVNERNITFLSLKEMMSALTPKRLELLRYLRHNEAFSVKALALSMGRDYKRVHEDVKILEAAGIIVREKGRIGIPWAALAAQVAL